VSLSDDVVRATCWLNEISIELNRCALDHDRQSRLFGKQIKEASEAQALEFARLAIKHDAESRRLLAKAAVVAACAQLSGDKPLRVRLMPDVFLLMRV
jgi:hypothetical protein